MRLFTWLADKQKCTNISIKKGAKEVNKKQQSAVQKKADKTSKQATTTLQAICLHL